MPFYWFILQVHLRVTKLARRASVLLEENKRMKPVQIALLVVAGAVGGAIVMKVIQRPEPVATVPLVAQNSAAQNTAPAAQPEPQAAEAPPPEPITEPEAKPSPIPERQRAIINRSKPVHRQETRSAAPIQVAQVTPPARPEAAPPSQPQAQPAPEPVAPAPREPENVTPPPPPPPPQPRQVTLNAGLLFPVRLIDGLSSDRNNPGDSFAGTLDQPLKVDGLVIAERGARVEGRVVTADKGSKVKGDAALSVELTRVHLSDGQSISVHTDSFEKRAEPNHQTDAAKVAGGAVIGAVIGVIAGGGKGAAIGAGAGGGAGAGDVLLTRKPAALPSETRITFRLSAPITVTEKQGS
jgi:hypothetical protein